MSRLRYCKLLLFQLIHLTLFSLLKVLSWRARSRLWRLRLHWLHQFWFFIINCIKLINYVILNWSLIKNWIIREEYIVFLIKIIKSSIIMLFVFCFRWFGTAMARMMRMIWIFLWRFLFSLHWILLHIICIHILA